MDREKVLSRISVDPNVCFGELDDFKTRYTKKKFTATTFQPGQVVEGFMGIDGGSTSTKAVLVDTALLEDLDKEAVDFYPNYDGTEMQPAVLPARFPCRRSSCNRCSASSAASVRIPKT